MLRRPIRSQKAKRYFRGQMRKKEARFELFGLQEANIPTLLKVTTVLVARNRWYMTNAGRFSTNFLFLDGFSVCACVVCLSGFSPQKL